MIRNLLTLLLWFSLLVQIPQLASADTTGRLIQSVQRLNTWLGEGEDTDRWRRALDMNVLESQAVLGYRADPVVLQTLIQRFQFAPGHPVFRDVQESLQDHLDVVNQSYVGDLSAAASNAKSLYRRPDVNELSAIRDRAIRDAQVLKKFYAATKSDVEGQEILDTIDVDSLISDLSEIEFKLPPARSAGVVKEELDKVSGEMRDLRDQLDGLLVNEETKPEREKLQKEIEGRQARADALTAERRAILEADRPRRTASLRSLRALQKYITNFEEAVLSAQDAYVATAKRSVERLFWRYRLAFDDILQSRFESAVDNLVEDLAGIDGVQWRTASARLGTTLGDLERMGQVPGLVAAVRRKYSLPNLQIRVSESLINELASRPVNDQRPVAETILGRFIQGQAQLNGNVNIDLIDNYNEAQMSILLRTSLASQTFTKQGPITAYAGSTGQVEARRSIYAGLGGLIINDAYAAANLGSRFEGVNCRLRIVNRIANKQYLKDKTLSEGISAGRLEKQTLDEFSKQTDEQLSPLRQQVWKFKERVMPYVAALPDMHLHTSDIHVKGDGIRVSPLTIGATREPAPGAANPEIAIKIHESLLSNYLNPFFAGRSFTNLELGDKIAELASTSAAAFEGDEWSITFSRNRPIQVEFDDNRFRVVVKGRQFKQPGRRAFVKSLQIQLSFKLVRDGEKIRVVRDGEAAVVHENEDDKDGASVAFVNFLSRKLNEQPAGGGMGADLELPPDLLPLDELPELGESPIAQKLRLVQFRAVDGWLQAGWNHVANEYESSVLDMPAIQAPTQADLDYLKSLEDGVEKPSSDGDDLAQPTKPGEDIQIEVPENGNGR